MNRHSKVLWAFLLCCTFISTSWTQDRSLQHLIQGKKFFWEAKFDRAITSLNNVINTRTVKPELLFEAYLYLGFVQIRRNASAAEFEANFEKAIRLDPDKKLDELVTPPDLAASYYAVRDRLRGCLHIIIDPPGAEIVIVSGDSISTTKTSPVTVCQMIDAEVQLLLKKEGFDRKFVPLKVTAGKTDTLRVTLNPLFVQKSGGSKFWPWMFRGGVVAAAGAVLYLTVLDEEKGGQQPIDLLPGPPIRPGDGGSN